MSRGVGTPALDFTRVVLCSSRMMSMQSSTHSSQMNTVGPAISLRTSCWLFPQKEQYRVFLESPPLDFVINAPYRARPRTPEREKRADTHHVSGTFPAKQRQKRPQAPHFG